MDIVFAGISLIFGGVPTITFSGFMSLCGNLVTCGWRPYILLSSSSWDVASFDCGGEGVCCRVDLIHLRFVWKSVFPDDIPLHVDSKIEFRVEVMKFIIAFRRKLVCDIHTWISFPMEYFFETNNLINSGCCHAWYYNHNHSAFEDTQWILRWFRYE